MFNNPVFSSVYVAPKKARLRSRIVWLLATLAMTAPLHAQSTMERLALDFNKTLEEVKQYIQRYIPDVTDAQMDHWEQTKALETCYINGHTR